MKEDVDIYGEGLLLANYKTVLNFTAFTILLVDISRQAKSFVGNLQNEVYSYSLRGLVRTMVTSYQCCN